MADLTHLSLFSGIGGLDLAAEWAGFRTAGQCEWADYPRAVLEKHWPGLPRWRDIRTLTKESFYEQTGLRTVSVLSGGFPCQPFSTAGKRRGKEDDRYLWPEMLRVIQEIRPAWVVGENVAGIVSMALDTVLLGLENIGYTCEAVIIPACAVDAPHRRDRCAILACSESERWGEARGCFRRSPERPTGCGKALADSNGGAMRNDGNNGRTSDREIYETVYPGLFGGAASNVADPPGGRKQRQLPGRSEAWGPCSGGCNVPDPDNQGLSFPGSEPRLQAIQPENGIEFGGWWPVEPDVGRVAHGVPSRVDRLKCLGNAVVPQQFYPIFRAIAELERMEAT